MNLFRYPESHYRAGQLDKQYLRVCATYKLLKDGKIDEPRAIELLEARQIRHADRTVSQWIAQREREGRRNSPQSADGARAIPAPR